MRLLSTDKDETTLFFYLEPVLGGPLHLHLRRQRGGRFDEDTVALYTAELLAALGHLRRKGCMHRDIKATNCLLDARGHLRLCDFSAARVMDADGATGGYAYTVVGTPEFMAPEMLLRDAGYSFPADVWSAGAS